MFRMLRSLGFRMFRMFRTLRSLVFRMFRSLGFIGVYGLRILRLGVKGSDECLLRGS